MLRCLALQSQKSPTFWTSSLQTHVRTLASFGRAKAKGRENDKGIEGTKKAKVKDPDNEFIKLWKSTENYHKDLLQSKILGKKLRPRRYEREIKVTTLPRQSELPENEASQLVEDSDKIGFRVPKFGEIVQHLGLVRSRNIDHESTATHAETTVTERLVKASSKSTVNFEDLGVHPKLIDRMQKYGIIKPVFIQQQALPLLYDNKSVLIKSETGSGKTLVFLLPSVQDPGRSCGTVIIVPTRELASQMLYEAHRLLGDKSIVASFVSGVDLSLQEKRLLDVSNPPRIVIGTPKRLLEIVEANESLFHRTKRIVVDEVDKILLPLHRRASRKKLISRALHPRPGNMLVDKLAKISKVPNKQFIGASATVDSGLLEDLADMGWGDHVTVVQSPSYEGKQRSIPSCIQHRYTVYKENLDISKANILARTFASSNQKSALVFIHRNLSVDSFVWELRYLGLQAVALYKKVATQNPDNHQQFLSDFHSGKFQLVVGTEETVRGLDFKDLEHVYLIEVAKNVEEYLHLAGRVGRQGKMGTATTIVSGDISGEERRMLLQYRRLGVGFQQV